MDPFLQRCHLARALREASEALLEASERALDFRRYDFSAQLLNESLQYLDLAREALQLPGKSPTREEFADPPF